MKDSESELCAIWGVAQSEEYRSPRW